MNFDDNPAFANLIRPGHVGEHLSTDVLVVGSGPGGSVTAFTLAEAGKEVMLLDAGQLTPPSPTSRFSITELQSKYWCSGLTFTLGTPRINYALGCCVGGGSEVNNGEFPDLPEEILARWQHEFLLEKISSHEISGYRSYIARRLKAEYTKEEIPIAQKLRRGAELLGWRLERVPRCFDQGRKESITMLKSLIPDALANGCRLLPQARVEKLENHGGKWVVVARLLNKPVLINCNTVFLCAGAIQTPVILRRSGFGRNIGRSLQFQPMIKLTARFPEAVNSSDMGIPSLQINEFAPQYTLGCSVSTPAYVALNLHFHGVKDHSFEQEWKHYANYYAMITPSSVARVKIFPFFREPFVFCRSDNNDLSKLNEAFVNLCRVLLTAGAEVLYPSISDERFRIKTEQDLENLPTVLPRYRTQLSAVHLSSSCPMGEDKKKCAVDSFGKLHEHENLYIADASIMCTAPSVNPQATIMALARRNALHYLAGG